MPVSVYLFILGVIFSLYNWRIISHKIYKRWRIIKALHSIPGPISLPLIGTVWQLKLNPLELVKQLLEWAAYYSEEGNNILKIWVGPSPKVLIIRPEAARDVLESTTLITKGNEYEILMPWLGSGLLISTGSKWQQRRKLLTPSFHFNMLNEFMSIFDYQAKIFLDQIEPYSTAPKHFDIFPFIKRCALDIICETAMGTHVSAQTNHDHEYVISVKRMIELAIRYHRRPWLQPRIIWWLTGYEKEYDEHLKVVTEFTKNVIQEKLNSPRDPTEKKKVFLDMLLDLYDEGKFDYEDIKEEVDTFMTLWCLAKHPDYQRKVQEELDSVFGNGDREVTVEDLKKLKYLESCIKEALRLRPTVPFFTREVTEDIEIDGHLIPEGCSVIVCPYMIHVNKNHFVNPLEYNPERFIEENSTKRHPYAFIPFSAGPRNCIGQKFAMMEEKTLLAWFFRKYNVTSKASFEDNLLLPLPITRPIFGFPVKITKRSE